MTISDVYIDPRSETKRTPDHCINIKIGHTVTILRHRSREEAVAMRQKLINKGQS